MGFRPDDLDGHMFDKAYYHGTMFPDEEGWDYKNNAKLQKHVHIGKGEIGKEGYQRIPTSGIKKADQSQYNDKGKVRKHVPSKTFSGHARKKNK